MDLFFIYSFKLRFFRKHELFFEMKIFAVLNKKKKKKYGYRSRRERSFPSKLTRYISVYRDDTRNRIVKIYIIGGEPYPFPLQTKTDSTEIFTRNAIGLGRVFW